MLKNIVCCGISSAFSSCYCRHKTTYQFLHLGFSEAVKADVAQPNVRVWSTECDWVTLHQQIGGSLRDICATDYVTSFQQSSKLSSRLFLLLKSEVSRSKIAGLSSRKLACFNVAVSCCISMNVAFIDTLTLGDEGSEQTLRDHKGIFLVCFFFLLFSESTHQNDWTVKKKVQNQLDSCT